MCSRDGPAAPDRPRRGARLQFNLGIETEFFLVRREDDRDRARPTRATCSPRAAYDVAEPARQPAVPRRADRVHERSSAGTSTRSTTRTRTASSSSTSPTRTHRRWPTASSLWRMMTKLVARRHGCEATFMPKPYCDRTGNGGHFNMSLADLATGENVFADPRRPARRGRLARSPTNSSPACSRHAPAICAVACPTVNSYKRLVKTRLDDRLHVGAGLHLVRAQQPHAHAAHPDRAAAGRVAAPSTPRCNPYLAAAMYPRRRPRGHREGPRPRRPDRRSTCTSRATSSSRDWASRRSRGRCSRPSRRSSATRSPSEVLGAELDAVLRRAEDAREWWDYHNTVSEWEHDRYLEFF